MTATIPTIKLWVAPHDDEEVGYIVNTIEDMEENFDDLLDTEAPDFEIRDILVTPSSALRAICKERWDEEFAAYCATWIELEIPPGTYAVLSQDQLTEWVAARI